MIFFSFVSLHMDLSLALAECLSTGVYLSEIFVLICIADESIIGEAAGLVIR
jgi:hypothetical protein